MARIVIAGCGDVGSAAGSLLAQAGHEVIGLRRQLGHSVDGVQMVAADLCDEQALRALPGKVDQLIYVAAADEFTDQAYQRAYVLGLQTLLRALSDSPLQRLLFVSSTSVYAQNDGAWIDEHSPAQAKSFSGQRLLQAEMIAGSSGVASCVVRFGGIYGPGRTRLIEQVRAGAVCYEDPPQWTNRIHRDDSAGVLRHLTQVEDSQPLYIGVDSEPATQCEVMQWLAQRMQVPAPVCASRSSMNNTTTRRRRGGNKRCNSQRLVASGYQFLYPSFKQGYSALLDSND